MNHKDPMFLFSFFVYKKQINIFDRLIFNKINIFNLNSNNKKNSNFHIFVLFSYLKVWLLLNRILFVFYILFFFFQIKDDSLLISQKSKHVITFHIRNIFPYILLIFLKYFKNISMESNRILSNSNSFFYSINLLTLFYFI